MPTNLLSGSHDCNSPYYLLGFNQDDINALTEDDSDSLDDGILDKSLNEEEEEEEQQQQQKIKSTGFFMDKFNPPTTKGTPPPPPPPPPSTTIAEEISLLHDTKTVKREKQTFHSIPESRSSGILFTNGTLQSFTCDISCSQHISYSVISTLKYRQFDLGKLDVVLNENSVLDVQMDCTLNGLDILGHPAWLTDVLSKIMKSAGFANITLQEKEEDRCFQFGVQKAFVTTPLSYLLEKQAPHGVLDTIYLNLDWQLLGDSEQFLSNWKDGEEKQIFVDYVKEALFEMLIRRVFHYYPLIFSHFQVKRLAPVISQLPHISHSLFKIMQTAKDTSPNRDFTKKLADKVKMIEANTMIMRPHYSEVSENMANNEENDDSKNSTTTSLTLGMYYTLTNNAKQQQRKSDPLSKIAALSMRDSPDALEAIGKIWSITCSSAASTLTE